ncbi:hypothetical protein RhiirA5_424264 [Rhizophagus irregularis]|uniref:Uncharacterized protein n=1 Tax=Rhizophagus irregularis TaxID=588596 RepID=A0A2N0P8E2_9GLOM|nr:hypothetical protein RhiirA5_424264 [Rhizophagus irregularis]
MKFTKKGYVLISLASLSYSLLSDQYKKHAGVQDTTTTDTSSSNNIHALITITDKDVKYHHHFYQQILEKMGGKLDVENSFNNENENLIKDFEEKQRKIILEKVKQIRIVVKCV